MIDDTECKINIFKNALNEFGQQTVYLNEKPFNSFLLKDVFVESKFINFLKIVKNVDFQMSNEENSLSDFMPIGIIYESVNDKELKKFLTGYRKYVKYGICTIDFIEIEMNSKEYEKLKNEHHEMFNTESLL